MNAVDFSKKIYEVGAPIGVATALTFLSFSHKGQQAVAVFHDLGEGLVLAQGSSTTGAYINITPTEIHQPSFFNVTADIYLKNSKISTIP